MSMDEARAVALEALQECRAGRTPSKTVPVAMPTFREALMAYGAAKKVKASSINRYDSIFRTHFGGWLDRSSVDLGGQISVSIAMPLPSPKAMLWWRWGAASSRP
jgi:hypothetical protein